jgi:acyl-CoA reductase-like NAD-dependent aldehyde dehydrogenase
METITYSHVQDLLQQLPAERLPAAYQVLRELAERGDTLQSQLAFRQLPLAERRKILKRQAEELKAHYEESREQRSDWQAGEFLNESSAG